MKFKVLVLFVTVAFLLFGCNKNNAENKETEATKPAGNPTAPIGNTNTEPTLPDLVGDSDLPQDVIVNPDGSIELPPVEFGDEFHQGGTLQPVVKPTEPPQVGKPENTEEEEYPTEPDLPDFGNGDELPPDIWE